VGVLDCPGEERYDGYAIKQEKEKSMAQSILNGKSILMVDDEPDILEVLEKEITEACPDCTIEKATTYEKAAELLKSHEFDLVILARFPGGHADRPFPESRVAEKIT
jgi:PleD family two-component response regulator